MNPDPFPSASDPDPDAVPPPAAAADAGCVQLAAILSGVDAVACQVTLLALNATVEAARAGDTGRGSAFVAAEVQHLARRSAEAAHRIRSLIAGRVCGGSDLGRHAEQAMNDILRSIREVGDIATGIGATGGVHLGALPQPSSPAP